MTQSNLNNLDLVSKLRAAPFGFREWIGVAGYDSRPRVLGGDVLPVAYSSGNACNHIANEGDIEEGDLIGFVSSPPIGAVIDVPDYSGCHHVGYEQYTHTPTGWASERLVCFSDE